MGLSPLYTRFFGDEAALGTLAVDLGAVFEAPSLALDVVWSETEKAGTITLHVPESHRGGEPLAAALAAGDPVPAQELGPLLAPLGRYREALGGRYDLRILSFDIRLAFWDHGSGSYCSIGGELGDPAGQLLGACFRCLDVRAGGGVQVCRDEPAWPARVSGEKRIVRMLTRALKSNPVAQP